MRRGDRLVVTTALVAVGLLAAACGKKEGGSCAGSESTCVDKGSAIACRAGKFTTVACAGPNGCAKYQEHASCDTSVANAGDACMGEDDEYACAADKKRAVVCRGGKFASYLECRGKAGCSMLGRTVSCDTSVAARGDVCKTQGAVACTEDQKEMVICRDGKFDLYRYCRGQYGCFTKADAPSCDETLSVAGDPCGLPGQVVCSVDGKNELVCTGGAFTKSLGCKTGCTVSNRPGRPIDCR